jgi:DNA processing protein
MPQGEEPGVGDQRRYWVGFNRVIGIGPVRLKALLEAFGDAETAWHASADDLRAAGLDQRCLRGLLEARDTLDLDDELARIERLGYRLLTWEEADYPERLREIPAPPPVLYLWGDLRPQDRWAAAVVGTRRPTAYGTAVARDLAAVLAASGVTVVSGLARGIDIIAHQSALEAGGRTLAVLGSGLDRLYPPEHRHLAERIAGGGAVLSDYPLGTAPEAGNFPPRNRIISGLALAVVIVEAGEGSGALITADFAGEQGREVFAVPGSIYSRASRGTNRLIRSGARPLVAFEDVLEALNLDVVIRQEEVSQALPEDETEAKILAALSSEPVHVDELQARCGLPAAQISASLAMLELKGRARQVGGMHYVRAREPRADYQVE